MSSTILKLTEEFKELKQILSNLIASVPVHRFRSMTGVIVILAADYYFAQLTPEQQRVQHEIKRRYERWLERVRLMFSNAPDQIKTDLDGVDEKWRMWLEFSERNWSVVLNPESNVKKFNEDVDLFLKLLEVFGRPSGNLLVVPDTNSLLDMSDPTAYRDSVGNNIFTFVLMPTVLCELDSLKNLHRNPDVRDKSEKAIKRIKGWRNQGSLLSGVTVDGTITVTAIADEPRMEKTLSWLDSSNADDRIIASVIQLQTVEPTARVVLVTKDINLQNKADAAAIETRELSDAN